MTKKRIPHHNSTGEFRDIQITVKSEFLDFRMLLGKLDGESRGWRFFLPLGCEEWILGGEGAREREREREREGELRVSGKGGDGKVARGRGGFFGAGKWWWRVLCGAGEGGFSKWVRVFFLDFLRKCWGWLFGVFVRGQDGRILDLIGALDVRGCNTLVGFLG